MAPPLAVFPVDPPPSAPPGGSSSFARVEGIRWPHGPAGRVDHRLHLVFGGDSMVYAQNVSSQVKLEPVMSALLLTAHDVTGEPNLCLAAGVGLSLATGAHRALDATLESPTYQLFVSAAPSFSDGCQQNTREVATKLVPLMRHPAEREFALASS